jgi:hypothetical protein
MIRIFVTGATFDKDYDELTGSLVFFTNRLVWSCFEDRARIT